MTRGDTITIIGRGLKIIGNEERKDMVGVFFVPDSGEPIKAKRVAVNTRKTLKVLVPLELKAGESYTLALATQSSSKRGGTMLKEVRNMRSSFKLVAA
jgi:hypothetical protein